MTKEEILEKRRHILGNQLMALLSDTILNMMDEWAGAVISNSSSITTTHQIPKRILDEYAASYAKQQAIAFHVFTMNEIWQYNATEDTWHQYNWGSEGVSFEVVWNQFIEQQNKP